MIKKILTISIIIVSGISLYLITTQAQAQMKPIEVGDYMPVFQLKDQNGHNFNIADVLGKKNLVIFFYPKDDSPGCTKQACTFRDNYDDFENADAIIIGISGQSVDSHRSFSTKHQLNYTLLSDEGNKVRKSFGVPSNLLGILPGRVTYIVNKDGQVVYKFSSQLQVTRHVSEALKVLKNLK
jgi:peroxiredoxin Q/BCP